MELNDMIKNKYKSFTSYTDIISHYKKNKLYLISLYHNNVLLLRGTYIYIGTYSRTKNIWIWGDQSFTLDKSMVQDITNIRKNILDKNIETNIRNFVKTNYMVITSSEIDEYFRIIDKLLNGDILFTDADDMINVVILTKMMQNNIA